MFRFTLIVACLVSSLTTWGSISKADWTDGAFPVKTHDFGTVAVASKTEFVFPIYNTTGSEMHIQTVRASCGCTTPILSTNTIPPGGQGSLLARFNTPTFRGKKGATLTVVIDRPFYSEVQLRVDGYIRSDMVFHPGEIEFGSVNQGDGKLGQTKLYYAGRSDWQVVDTRANQPWLIPSFKQVERAPGKATYELSVQVREDAPEGFFQDEIIVQTNDRSMPRVPLRVTGKVVTALTVSPQSLALGKVRQDESILQRLVLKGREPFAIASIECEGWTVDFNKTDEKKKIHVISVTLKPKDARGNQRTPLVIQTAGDDPITTKAILMAEITAEQIAQAN